MKIKSTLKQGFQQKKGSETFGPLNQEKIKIKIKRVNQVKVTNNIINKNNNDIINYNNKKGY